MQIEIPDDSAHRRYCLAIDPDHRRARADVARVLERATDLVFVILQVDHTAADNLYPGIAEFLAGGRALLRHTGQLQVSVFERYVLDAHTPAAGDGLIHGEFPRGIGGHPDFQAVEIRGLFLSDELRVRVCPGSRQRRGHTRSRQPERLAAMDSISKVNFHDFSRFFDNTTGRAEAVSSCTRISMRQIAAVLFLTGALSLRAPAQSSLGLIQPDAGLVFGLEWRKIVDSSVGGALIDQLKKSNLPEVPGFHGLQDVLLHDLDSVTISSSASGLSKNTSQPPVLVVVKGRFDLEMLRNLVGKNQNAEKYKGVDLLGPPAGAPKMGAKPGADNNRVAFIDANTILAGDRAEIRNAIDRIKTGRLTEANRGILAGVADLASKNDLWMMLEIPANALKDAPPAAAQMFSAVKSTSFGMSFGQGFGMQMNVRTKDVASAQSMAQTIQGLISMAAMSQSATPQSTEMIKKIKIAAEGSDVKLALALDKSELEQLIKEAQADSLPLPRLFARPWIKRS